MAEDRPIAVYSASLGESIEILKVQYGIRDVIFWRWSKEKRIHKSLINDIGDKVKFRVNRQWIALDECILQQQ